MKDYENVKSMFPTKAEFCPFFYQGFRNFNKFNLNSDRESLRKYIKDAGKIVLLGNSGYPTCNHLDALERLRSLRKISDFNVLCPLSYGNQAYIDYVIKHGRALLGDNFTAMTEYIEKEAYFNVLGHVDIAVMYQNSMRAMSAISILLYFGKKVYLKKANTAYKFLKENGVSVFNIETDFTDTPANIFSKLPSDDQERNKRIIIELFSDKRAVENISRMIKL